MNKDRQHINHDIDARNSISYEHNERIFNCFSCFQLHLVNVVNKKQHIILIYIAIVVKHDRPKSAVSTSFKISNCKIRNWR